MKAPAADITIRENYLDFINKATKECSVNQKNYDRIVATKDAVYEELTARKGEVALHLHIDLDIYTEYTAKQFNDTFALYNRVNKMYRDSEFTDYRELVTLVLKWCSILNKERECLEYLYISSIKADMNYNQYREYVFKYYSAIHKHMLKGDGYKFAHGVGIVYVDRIQLTSSSRKIDFAKTKKRKEQLIAQGKKLFNKEEYDACVAAGKDYDGEDYRVFMDAKHFIKLPFINSHYFRGNGYDFRPTHTINEKYRGIDYPTLIERFCKTPDDIADLRVDIRTKVALLLMMDNTKCINFDRKLV